MTASSIKDARLSEFTLALLEGSGWYQVNYSFAEPMTYGKSEGCAFLDTPCMNKETKQQRFAEFCSPLSAIRVSWTNRGFGVCGAVAPTKKPELPDYFDYWGDKTAVSDIFADNCPNVQILRNTDCEDSSLQVNASLGAYEHYGYGSKAFLGSMDLGKTSSGYLYGYCFKTRVII